MSAITDSELTAIEERAAKATEGPIARGIRPEPLDLAETLTQRSDRDHA